MAHLSRIVFPTSLAPIAYDPASRIATENRDDDAYSFVKSDGTTATTTNGLNQVATVNGASATYDANGNMTFDPTTGRTFTYDSQNQLVSSTLAGATASLTYDPLGRLYQLSSPSGVRRFLYSTDDTGTPEPISEYDTSNGVTVDNLYGYGPGPDEPLLWWDGAAGLAQRNLQADEHGSIVAVTDASGNPIGINAYDEYGVPAGTNSGLFGYTGQLWLPEVGLYYYKARMYLPGGGVFLQTDPIGMADNANLYAYVHNDSVNLVDPMGLAGCPVSATIIIVCGRLLPQNGSPPAPGAANGGSNDPRAGDECRGDCRPIVVTARRRNKQNQGRPAQCFTIRYQIGQELDSLGRTFQRLIAVGGTFATLASAAEGGGLATALFAIDAYEYASDVRTIGQTLMYNRRAPIEFIASRAIGTAAGAGPLGRLFAEQMLAVVDKYTPIGNPCEL